MSTKALLAIPLVLIACNSTPSSESPATITAPVTAGRRAFHYDLVLTSTDGTTNSRVAFSVDLTDGAQGSAAFFKNVSLPNTSRIDVGTRVKCRLAMEGDAPHLEVDVETSSLDSASKIRKATLHGGAATPLGAPTVVLDTSDGGVRYKLTAIPMASAAFEPKITEASGDTYVVDIAVTHTGDGAPPAPTLLTLKLAGDAAAIAQVTASVPLSASDAGVISPRQDTGTRMKATGHAHGASLVLDFDYESTAAEAATPGARIRKMTSRGELVAPFDQPTTAFTGEEDGHRYTVTVTPHHAK